jgi:hypothetical protein
MVKIYRPGAIGALLDEYERAIAELKLVITDITDDDLVKIVDPDTASEHCRSIQTVLTHVVSSGYVYATCIFNLKGHNLARPEEILRFTVKAYRDDLDSVFTFTESVFNEIKDNELEQMDAALKIKSRWGQLYDIEQMTEHAIVHILRHRRQIEKFKLLLG